MGGAMPKLMQGMKKLPQLQEKLKQTSVTGEALEGRVKVTLLVGDLSPKSVDIDESLLSDGASAGDLGEAVVVAMRSAHNAATEKSRASLAEFYSSMGVPMPDEPGA